MREVLWPAAQKLHHLPTSYAFSFRAPCPFLCPFAFLPFLGFDHVLRINTAVRCGMKALHDGSSGSCVFCIVHCWLVL